MSIIDQIADERDKAQQENKLLKQRIKRLEEELNELRSDEARLLNSNGELERRIKRLEEVGNNLLWNFCPEYTSDFTESQSDALKQWNKSKEAKP